MKKGWQEYFNEGKRALEDNNFSSARASLQRVVEEKDNFADVHNMLGIIHYNEGRHDEAIKAFTRALELNPRYTEASLNLAVVYNEKGEFDKGESVYLDAKKVERKEDGSYLDPFVKGKLANMHAELGNIYKNIGYYFEACHEYKKALDLRPEFLDVKTNLGIVYREMKEYAMSVRKLDSVVKHNQEYAPAWVQLGLTYYVMGKHDRAQEKWEKVLKMNPEDKLVKMYLNLVSGTPK